VKWDLVSEDEGGKSPYPRLRDLDWVASTGPPLLPIGIVQLSKPRGLYFEASEHNDTTMRHEWPGCRETCC